MQNKVNSSLSVIPREVVSQSIVFPYCDVKTIITFSRISKEYYCEIVDNIKGLYTRDVSFQFPHTEFLRFIDGYKKMIYDLKEAENLFIKTKQLFHADSFAAFLSNNGLVKNELVHNDILSLDCLGYEENRIDNNSKKLLACLRDVLRSFEILEDQIFLKLVLVSPQLIAGFCDGLIMIPVEAMSLPVDKFYCSHWMEKMVGLQNMDGPIYCSSKMVGQFAGLISGCLVLVVIFMGLFIWGPLYLMGQGNATRVLTMVNEDLHW